MNYVEKLLTPNEQVVRIARDHWIVLLLTILVDAAISIVIIGLSIAGSLLLSLWSLLGLLLLIVPFIHLGLRLWVWWNKKYIITNQRLIQVTGTFNKRVSDTLLEKINDIIMEQSAFGRMLKFGDISVISGSESGIDTFRHLAAPIAFKTELLNQREKRPVK